MKSSAGTWVFLGMFVIVVVVTSKLLFFRHDIEVGLAQEIQYDDFAFSVLSSRKSRMLGTISSPKTTEGTFYIVELKIHNRSKATSFHFDRSVVWVQDAKGGEKYFVSDSAQTVIQSLWKEDRGCAADIEPGSFCVTELVFEVPHEFHHPVLGLRLSGPFREMFDWLFSGRKTIRLA